MSIFQIRPDYDSLARCAPISEKPGTERAMRVASEQRSHMGRHVNCQTLVRPASNAGHQDQMAGGTDGQEFSDALDEGENDDVQQWQGGLQLATPLPEGRRGAAYSIAAGRDHRLQLVPNQD